MASHCHGETLVLAERVVGCHFHFTACSLYSCGYPRAVSAPDMKATVEIVAATMVDLIAGCLPPLILLSVFEWVAPSVLGHAASSFRAHCLAWPPHPMQ